MASPSEQRKLVERYIAAYATGDVSQVDEIIAPDFVDHSYPDYCGPQGVAAGIRHVHEGLTDVSIELDFFVCDAESLAFMVTAAGTHTGEFVGKPPTGNRIVWKLADFVRVRDGKFSELWNVADNVALLLGAGAKLV
jgi:predicted ester cyclase